jgi:molybdopterin synthase sulfur carrier subunit
MKWRLFATLAETAGDTQVEVPVDGDEPTVDEALDALLATHPELEPLCMENGELADHVRLLVDGADPRQRGEGLDTPVDPDTELAIFPPVSGG